MIRASENAVRSIVCRAQNIQNLKEIEIAKKLHDNGYPFIYFAYLQGTDTDPFAPGLYML